MMRIAPLFIWALLATVSSGAENKRIDFSVVCSDPAAARSITGAIETEIKKYDGFEVSSEHPSARLFVYAQQDVNDRMNTNGWSFAVAHVSNLPSQVLALRLLDSTATEVEEVKPLLLSMLKEEGFLTHLNVAHVDELSTQALQVVMETIVGDFVTRMSNDTK
jgi:hypothetical protein